MEANPALLGAIRPQLRGGDADAVVAALAKRQHDVVARSQLLALGLGRDAIKHRLASKRLRRLHRGVYTTGHAELSADAWAMAGVLSAGRGAKRCHRSAGH